MGTSADPGGTEAHTRHKGDDVPEASRRTEGGWPGRAAAKETLATTAKKKAVSIAKHAGLMVTLLFIHICALLMAQVCLLTAKMVLGGRNVIVESILIGTIAFAVWVPTYILIIVGAYKCR